MREIKKKDVELMRTAGGRIGFGEVVRIIAMRKHISEWGREGAG